MNIQKLCEKIALPQPVQHRVLQADEELNYEALKEPLRLLMERDTGLQGFQALTAALGEDPEGIKMLTCQLHCACLRYESYQKLGISDEIYFATMSCYTRFVTECLYYKGGYQFDRGWWTWRQLSLSVFRLGQLEFELREDGGISVHIPTATDLSPAAVDASLTQAADFLRRYFPDYAESDFTCRSWLLSPALSKLLDEKSRILSFLRRFEIREVDEENGDYISWLFQSLPGTPVENLPERTSLQRKAKQHLMQGGKIGNAYGVLIGRRAL